MLLCFSACVLLICSTGLRIQPRRRHRLRGKFCYIKGDDDAEHSSTLLCHVHITYKIRAAGARGTTVVKKGPLNFSRFCNIRPHVELLYIPFICPRPKPRSTHG